MLLVEPMVGPTAGAAATEAPRFDPIELWVFLLLLAALAAQAGGFFYYLALVILALILAPMVIAVGFSIWAGKLPSAAAAAPPPMS